MPVRLAQATADALANAVNTRTNSGGAGKIAIYQGTQPANGDGSVSGATKLVEFTLHTTAFGSASAGVVTLQNVPLTQAAIASGTAQFFRMVNGAGDPVLDGTVGIAGSGAQLILNTTAINASVNVTITSGTVTMPTT